MKRAAFDQIYVGFSLLFQALYAAPLPHLPVRRLATACLRKILCVLVQGHSFDLCLFASCLCDIVQACQEGPCESSCHSSCTLCFSASLVAVDGTKHLGCSKCFFFCGALEVSLAAFRFGKVCLRLPVSTHCPQRPLRCFLFFCATSMVRCPDRSGLTGSLLPS